MSTNPLFSANPFLSQWLSVANTAAGAWRGFWTAELARQQSAMLTEWNRQAVRFWTGAWAQRPAAAAPAAVVERMAEAAVPPPALTVPPVLSAVSEAAEVTPAAPAVTVPEAPAPVVAPKPAKVSKPAAQLRTPRPGRKVAAKRPASGAKRDRHTRH